MRMPYNVDNVNGSVFTLWSSSSHQKGIKSLDFKHSREKKRFLLLFVDSDHLDHSLLFRCWIENNVGASKFQIRDQPKR